MKLPGNLTVFSMLIFSACIHLYRDTYDVIGQFSGLKDSIVLISYQSPGSSETKTDTLRVKQGGVIEYTGRVHVPRMVTLRIPSMKQSPAGSLHFLLTNTNYLITADADSLNKAVVNSGPID